jgi:hypothetical protein
MTLPATIVTGPKAEMGSFSLVARPATYASLMGWVHVATLIAKRVVRLKRLINEAPAVGGKVTTLIGLSQAAHKPHLARHCVLRAMNKSEVHSTSMAGSVMKPPHQMASTHSAHRVGARVVGALAVGDAVGDAVGARVEGAVVGAAVVGAVVEVVGTPVSPVLEGEPVVGARVGALLGASVVGGLVVGDLVGATVVGDTEVGTDEVGLRVLVGASVGDRVWVGATVVGATVGASVVGAAEVGVRVGALVLDGARVPLVGARVGPVVGDLV